VILHLGDLASDPLGPAPLAFIEPYQSDRQALLSIVCTVERDPATLIDREGDSRDSADRTDEAPRALAASFIDGANWDPTASIVAGVNKLGPRGLMIAVAHREGIQRMIYVYG
jgi:hypothetical protein